MSTQIFAATVIFFAFGFAIVICLLHVIDALREIGEQLERVTISKRGLRGTK